MLRKLLCSQLYIFFLFIFYLFSFLLKKKESAACSYFRLYRMLYLSLAYGQRAGLPPSIHCPLTRWTTGLFGEGGSTTPLSPVNSKVTSCAIGNCSGDGKKMARPDVRLNGHTPLVPWLLPSGKRTWWNRPRTENRRSIPGDGSGTYRKSTFFCFFVHSFFGSWIRLRIPNPPPIKLSSGEWGMGGGEWTGLDLDFFCLPLQPPPLPASFFPLPQWPTDSRVLTG